MRKTIKGNLTMAVVGICMSAAFISGCGDRASGTADNATNQSAENTEDQNDSFDQSEDSAQTDGNGAQGADANLELGTYPDGSSPELSDVRVRLTIEDQEVIIRLYQNTAVDAFMDRLPMEDLNFSDLSGIEKPVDIPDDEFSIGDEVPGYDPTAGEMVIYRPWGNFTIFYGDFRHSDELVPLGIVESGLDIVAGQTEDFTGTMEVVE